MMYFVLLEVTRSISKHFSRTCLYGTLNVLNERLTHPLNHTHILTVYLLAIFAKTPQDLNILLHICNAKSFGILPEVHGRYAEKCGTM